MTRSSLIIGSRGSALALRQAEIVRARLAAHYPHLTFSLKIIRTSGDRITEHPLTAFGGKGLFVKELEEALLAKAIDFAVHSLKDMTAELPEGLHLAAILEREDPRDALVTRTGEGTVRALPEGAIVGTSSLRRLAQLRALRPDLDIRPLRGNVDTRLRKLDDGHYEAIILATAGLLLAAVSAAAAESRLKRILDSGVLRAGTTGDWNPMTIRDPASNSYKGYDIDMLSELAADLGVRIEFVATDWKTIVQGIQANKYDITGSASLSPARAKVAGFSDPYLELATVPLTLKKNAGRFKDWADLDKPEVTVAATLGTVQEQQVKQFFPNARHKIVESPARDFQEVLAGRADAHIT